MFVPRRNFAAWHHTLCGYDTQLLLVRLSPFLDKRVPGVGLARQVLIHEEEAVPLLVEAAAEDSCPNPHSSKEAATLFQLLAYSESRSAGAWLLRLLPFVAAAQEPLESQSRAVHQSRN